MFICYTVPPMLFCLNFKTHSLMKCSKLIFCSTTCPNLPFLLFMFVLTTAYNFITVYTTTTFNQKLELKNNLNYTSDQEEKEKFERTVIEILTHRSNVQRQQICITYKKIYQKVMFLNKFIIDNCTVKLLESINFISNRTALYSCLVALVHTAEA